MNTIRELLSYQFMVNAFRAAGVVAVISGAVGWFMILRKETFAGHTLAVVGFPGAAGASLAGLPPSFGYFAFCTIAALIISGSPRARSVFGAGDRSALIGQTQAQLLALGFLFVSLYAGNLNGLDSLLFGSFLGISSAQVAVLVAVSIAVAAVLATIGRRLLFASVEPAVALASGVNVPVMDTAFMLLLGVTVAEASQITGVLLVFALLVLPPATAWRVTPRPIPGMITAIAIGLAAAWLGLALAFYTNLPAGFWVTTLAFSAYAATHVGSWAIDLRRKRLEAAIA
jgi:zinc/manganese transport system permease protein